MALVYYSDSDEEESCNLETEPQVDLCNFFEPNSNWSPSIKNTVPSLVTTFQLPQTSFWISGSDGTIDLEISAQMDSKSAQIDPRYAARKRKPDKTVNPTHSHNTPKYGKFSHKKMSSDRKGRWRECHTQSCTNSAANCSISSSGHQETWKKLTLQAHEGPVNRLVWAPTSFCRPHLLASVGMDRGLKVWDLSTFCAKRGRRPPSSALMFEDFSHKGAVKGCAWKDGQCILTASADSTTRLWNFETGQHLACHHHLAAVSSVVFVPWSRDVYLSGSSSLLTTWDLRGGDRPVQSFLYRNHFGQVVDIALLPGWERANGGGQFVSCSDIVDRDSSDRTLMVWDFRTVSVVSGQIYQERYGCTRVCAHPDGHEFAAQTHGDYIALFSGHKPYKMNKRKCFTGHKVSAYPIGCSYRKDGRLLASGSADGRLVLYDVATCDQVASLSTEEAVSPVVEAAWNPSVRDILAGATWDGRIVVFAV